MISKINTAARVTTDRVVVTRAQTEYKPALPQPQEEPTTTAAGHSPPRSPPVSALAGHRAPTAERPAPRRGRRAPAGAQAETDTPHRPRTMRATRHPAVGGLGGVIVVRAPRAVAADGCGPSGGYTALVRRTGGLWSTPQPDRIRNFHSHAATGYPLAPSSAAPGSAITSLCTAGAPCAARAPSRHIRFLRHGEWRGRRGQARTHCMVAVHRPTWVATSMPGLGATAIVGLLAHAPGTSPADAHHGHVLIWSECMYC